MFENFRRFGSPKSDTCSRCETIRNDDQLKQHQQMADRRFEAQRHDRERARVGEIGLTPVASCPSVTRAARSVCVAAIPSQTRATDDSLLPVVLQF